MNDLDGFWVITFFLGLIIGAMAVGVFDRPAYDTLTALCDQKYGEGNWASTVEDNYWICNAKTDPVCKVDGLGLERCKKQ